MPTSDTVPVIETRDLRKEYGTTVAVAGLNLAIERGEAFGFLGPNGAGKTTSLKALLGLVRPTAGKAYVLGLPAGDPRGRRRIGFLPEHFRFHEWLRGLEFLDLHGKLLHMSAEERRDQIPELLDLVGLRDAGERPLSTYSKGMLQRIGLAQALLNHPEVVFLDEPTSGLDPMGRRMVREIIAGLRDQGTTIFLNSHILSEVELTCSRIAIIKDGVVAHTAGLEEPADGWLVVDVRVGAIDDGLLAGLRRWDPQLTAAAEESLITLRVESESVLPEIARSVVARGTDLYSLTPRRLSLEELYVELMGGDVPCETS